MFIIIDWQDEDDIKVLRSILPYNDKADKDTARFSKIEDATQRLVEESHATKNIYLKIVEI